MNVTLISSLSEVELGSGHVALSPMSNTSVDDLYDFISTSVIGSHQGRFTVVLPDIETHDFYFDQLDSRFPEQI